MAKGKGKGKDTIAAARAGLSRERPKSEGDQGKLADRRVRTHTPGTKDKKGDK
ncbi:hypothetical protein ACWGJ2_04170 [Streptomyces sp. NPDC054796]